MIVEEHPKLVPAVKSLLGNLRWQVRRYVWAEGLSNSLAWLGTAFWISLAIDWFFEPPIIVRVLLLSVAITILLVIVARQIIRRAFTPLTDGNMATLLERRFPQLNDSLLTAVMLCDKPGGLDECNPDMLARVCHEAAERIKIVRLDNVFNFKPLRNSFIAGILMIFSVIVFGIIVPQGISTWARRSLAFSKELWPRMSHLDIDGFPSGIRKVARGSDVDIVVRADTNMPRIPKVVEVRYSEQGGVRGRSTMNRLGLADPAKDKYQEFIYTRRNVLAPMRFDVFGGDDSIRDQIIEVVENPTAALTLYCEYPAYIKRPARNMPVTGVMSLPQGSRITINATANKELVKVQVDSIGEDNSTVSLCMLESDKLSSDHRGFQYTVASLDKDTTLLFTLFDTDGIRSREPVRLGLAAIADQPPQVAAQLDGIGTAITPQARIGVAGRVTDDYGIGKVMFNYMVDQNKPDLVEIKTVKELSTELVLNSRDAALEVRDLKLKPGQKLQLSVDASDLCALGKSPNTASGERWLLDVVTPEKLQIMLKARELVLRQRFESIIQETTETRDLLARMDIADKLNENNSNTDKKKEDTSSKSASTNEPEDEQGESSNADSNSRSLSLHILRVQRALGNSRKNAQETLGVADGIDDIRLQLVNNRIDTEELKERLQSGIANPLRHISDKMFPELDRRLDVLQSLLSEGKLDKSARDNSKAQADAILLSMQKVLDRMIEMQDYNEIVEMLRDIIKMQEQLRGQTEQRQKQKIRDLLKE